MNKTLKILLLTGLLLILGGGIVLLIVFAASGGNMDFLSTVKLEEKRFDESAENPIDDITIDFENAAIEVRIDDHIANLAIVYPQAQNNVGENISEITLTETDGALSIIEKRKWQFNLISWNFTSPKVVLHLPSHRTYDLSLTTKNGKISFDGASLQAKNVFLFTDNGAIETETTEIACSEAFLCETDNGAVKLGFITAEHLTAQTDNGAVELNGCNVSAKAYLETDNGKITLVGNITANELIAETDNGGIQAQSAIVYAQKITLSTNLGDIRAKLAGKHADYTATIEHDLGNTNIYSSTGGEKSLSVNSDVGDIQIDFTE